MLKLRSLRWWSIFSLVRLWAAVGSLGHVALLAYCGMVIAAGMDVPSAAATWPLAIAVLAALLSTLRYLDYSPSWYATILTLRQSGPQVARFLVGVAPVFVALSLFALVVFGRTEPRYATPAMAVMTVFAFLNGDALREIFTHTERTGSAFLTVVGDIHLCLTILLFTYVVINCTIAIVEEAFFNTRTIDAQQLVRAARLQKIYTRQTVEELTIAADEDEAAVRRARKGEGHGVAPLQPEQSQAVAIEADAPSYRAAVKHDGGEASQALLHAAS